MKLIFNRVNACYHHKDKPTWDVLVNKLNIDEKLECTGNHPFYIQDKGFMQVGKIHSCKSSSALNGVDSTGEDIQITAFKSLGHHRDVFDLTIEKTHTFFVGKSGVWVHNSNMWADGDIEMTSMTPNNSPVSLSSSIENEQSVGTVYGLTTEDMNHLREIKSLDKKATVSEVLSSHGIALRTSPVTLLDAFPHKQTHLFEPLDESSVTALRHLIDHDPYFKKKAEPYEWGKNYTGLRDAV
ncbi:Hint domain-containing protein [Fangia hongkongensis]|uniref:Hint domain-containing protein n=1 Tax=Fangia hongkongensis TaxID=270495 RepID=UPI0003699E39|nr:Hint domain-containing protein [Fangia hongkongensis]MBK2126350.1 hypothetical protein [Fangia hongkongensis]